MGRGDRSKKMDRRRRQRRRAENEASRKKHRRFVTEPYRLYKLEAKIERKIKFSGDARSRLLLAFGKMISVT